MDLSRPIIYNGLTLSPPSASPTAPRSGYEINAIDVSPVAVDGYRDPLALRDGVDASDVYLRARQIVISAAVLGTSKGQLFDNLQAALAAFSPTLAYNADSASLGFLAFKFDQPTIDTATWTSGYIPLQFFARPAEPPRYSLRRVDTTDSGRGLSLPVQISLFAKDPLKYSQAETSLSVGTATATYSYNGDYPSWPIVTFTLTANGHSAMTITMNSTSSTGSASIILDLTSAYDSGIPTYTLDVKTRMFTRVNGQSTTYFPASISTSSILRPIDGGWMKVQNTNGFGGIGDKHVTVTWREAWA